MSTTNDKTKKVLDRWVEVDLTAEAAAGRLGRAYGRDDLVAAVEEVWAGGRSPVLVGEPGVGKTAIVHETLRRSLAGAGRLRLGGARVLQVSLRRGASTVGRDEALGDHFLAFAEAVVGMEREVVLYLRDLHLGWSLDLEEHLSGLVGRLAWPLIAEGEAGPMRTLLESEPLLDLACSLVEVAEPDLAATRRIVSSWADQLERGEQPGRPGEPAGRPPRLRPDALEAALQLSHRFLVRSRQPRKAMAPLQQLTALATVEAVAPRREVGEAEVVSLFCRQYGLPRALVDPHVRLDLPRLAAELHAEVLGQPVAVDVAVALLARIKAGLLDPRRPLGVFLFVGPSGVGKTLLARLLAERALGSADRMARFNMADYPDEDGVLQLFGNPSAYQQSSKQGLLTQRILGCQFGVLLLDELEKASPKVHDRLLQLVDEGSFLNGAGQQVPCRSLVIVATSNAGSGLWNDGPGFRDPAEGPVALPAGATGAALEERLRRHFRFELLNRFDEIVPFLPLERRHVRELVRRLVGEIEARPGLARLGARLEVSEAALEWLLDRGHEPRNGVRYLRRAVERELGTRVAEALVGAKVGPGEVLRVEVGEGALRVVPQWRPLRAAVAQ